MMKKIFQVLVLCLLLYIPVVGASALKTNTDNMISRIQTETSELNTTLTVFKDYLKNNKTKVANALDVAKLKTISTYLQASNYNAAVGVLESAVNDSNLTSIELASKINQYFTLKQDLINFVKANRTSFEADPDSMNEEDIEALECAFDLLSKIKESFNLVKPTITSMFDATSAIVVDMAKRELNNSNLKTSDINDLIDEYKELASLITALCTKYTNSIDAYAEVFEILGSSVGASNGLFNTTIKSKFREDFNKLLNDIEGALREPINIFIDNRWTNLENYVADLVESDKTDVLKNSIIYDKIDQVTSVNNKFVAAINEIIGNLDIESVKTKLNSILERGSTEFGNAIQYLRDHLIGSDYDIELVQNHDSKISINREKKLLILDKLFSINEFKNQIKLANNFGTLTFELGNYEYVPNKAIVRVTDNNAARKEYRVIVKGDVNNNGAITVTDVVKAAYYSLEVIELDEYEVMAADINNSNTITVTDVYLIAMKSLEGDE